MKHNLTGYVRHKCRCDICRAAASAAKRRSYLKNIEANRARGRAYAKAHPEQARERVRQWKARNPERAAELSRQTAKRYADRHREVVRQKNTEWRTANPDKAREATLAYHRANPEKAREAAKRRRVRLLGNELLVITERDWQRLCARFGDRCAYCDGPGPLQKDHVIPITRGGRHSIGNLLPACKPCNSSKNRKLLVEWRYRRARGLRQPTALSRKAS